MGAAFLLVFRPRGLAGAGPRAFRALIAPYSSVPILLLSRGVLIVGRLSMVLMILWCEGRVQALVPFRTTLPTPWKRAFHQDVAVDASPRRSFVGSHCKGDLRNEVLVPRVMALQSLADLVEVRISEGFHTNLVQVPHKASACTQSSLASALRQGSRLQKR